MPLRRHPLSASRKRPHACYARQLGEDGEQPGTRGGFEHHVVRRDGGRSRGHEAEWDRGRELLQRLALFRAARVSWQQGGDLAQHGKLGGGGPGAHGRAEPAQE